MSAARKRFAPRSIGAVIFDLVVIGFAALLVNNALGLRPGAALVPLIIGVPTLVLGIAILMLDLFPGLRRSTGADEGGGHGLASIRAAEEGDEDLDVLKDPALRRRQAAFAAWVIGFVALAAFTSVYIAMPVALVGIFLAIRLPLIQIVLIVSVTVLGLYGLFHHVLGLRL